MKKMLLSAVLATAPLFAMAQASVSINVGEPGFFGQINIGNAAPPPVVYAQPVVVTPPVGGVVEAPIYLRVPEEHHRHWAKYCHQYNACNRRVYFVTEEWYGHYHEYHHEHEHEHEHEHDHEHDHHD